MLDTGQLRAWFYLRIQVGPVNFIYLFLLLRSTYLLLVIILQLKNVEYAVTFTNMNLYCYCKIFTVSTKGV